MMMYPTIISFIAYFVLQVSARGCVRHVYDEGVLTSDGYPDGYQTGFKCKTWIHAPNGKVVRIEVDDLDLPTRPDGSCLGDTVRIFDGRKSRSTRLATLCGTITSGSYVTTQEKAYIRFKTDRLDDGGKGYRFWITFEDGTQQSTTTTTRTTQTTTPTTPTITTTRPVTTTTRPVSTTTRLPGSVPNWYSGRCGTSAISNAGSLEVPTGRIYGGINAVEREFPWQVLMWRNGRLVCGGTIISSHWVLTAAHCRIRRLPEFQLVVGAHKVNDISEASRQVLDLEEVYTHENFDHSTFDNDIVLIRTTQEINMNQYVQPACPPSIGQDFTYKKAVVSGWGYMLDRHGNQVLPSVLQYTTMNVTTRQYCQDKFGDEAIITDRMFCTTDNLDESDRDTCSGDSGGPLVVKQPDNTFTLAGITSYGIGCAHGYPGVYTRVSSFLYWIQDIMDNY